MIKGASIPRHLGFAIAILAGAICLIAAAVRGAGLLDSVELLGYDLLVSARGFERPTEELAIVDFDDDTVQTIGTFPIPRELLGETLEKITAGEPELIGLDILLSEKRTPEGDRRLAAALASAGNVILVENFAGKNLPASEPLPEFREHALDVAFANAPVDSDGFIRRMFLWVKTPSYAGVSFPVALASNYLKQGLQPGRPGGYRLGRIEIPLDGMEPNTALIGWWNPRPAFLTISARRLLSGETDSRTLKGKMVIVGQSSTAAKDLYATPIFRFRKPSEGRWYLSGMEIHAAAINTLLTGQTIRALGQLPLWTLNLLLCGLALTLIILARPLYTIPIVLVGVSGSFLLAQALFSHLRIWMPFMSTEAGVLLALPAGMGYRFLEERRLKGRAEAERQRLEQELVIARAIQQSLLPEALPKLDGLDIAVRYESTLLVGGDYYDFLLLDPSTLLSVIADVQGKGVSSALIMSNVQAALHALLLHVHAIEDILSTLNDCILRGTRGERFVTMFLCLLDLRRRGLHYVNAGHLPPVVVRAEGDPAFLNEEGGTVIGLFPQMKHTRGFFQLELGDVVLACTDGITEANNRSEEEYGCERMVQAAHPIREQSAQTIVDGIFNEVANFSVGGEHQDDKVLIAVKVV